LTHSNKGHFDKISPAYEGVYKSWESVYKKMKHLIDPLITGKNVLDVGNGGFFPYNTSLAAKVTVLDISPIMLERIQEPGIEKVVGDARDLSVIADGSVDVILFLLCLHHINGPSIADSKKTLDAVLSSAHRKLKPGGYLVVAEPFLPGFLYAIETFFFQLLRHMLNLFKVPMIFFYKLPVMKQHILKNFGQASEVHIEPLKIEGSVDPMGGSFPGLLSIPAWMCPTQVYLLKAQKTV
jgi:SAM-dependent methyltransferase